MYLLEIWGERINNYIAWGKLGSQWLKGQPGLLPDTSRPFPGRLSLAAGGSGGMPRWVRLSSASNSSTVP